MVYNGSKSGLNQALYFYWFPLPKVTTMFNILMNGYWNADEEYGEITLNFSMHSSICKYAGVDLDHIFDKNKDICGKLFGK